MWEWIQTVILVSALTVVVWLYAEADTVTRQTVTLDLRFVPPPGRELVIDPSERDRVEVTFRCAAAQLAAVEQFKGQRVSVPVDVDTSSADTRQDVNLRERLAAHEFFTRIGAEVDDTRPTKVVVDVEKYVTREFPVEAKLIGEGFWEATPVPATATVRMRESLAKQISDDTHLQARVDAKSLANLQLNVQHQREVPLTLPEALRASPYTSVTPLTVKVNFLIRTQTETITRNGVPVELRAPPSVLKKYDIAVAEDFLGGIKLTGPRGVIQKIAANEIKVWAEIRLSAEEVEKGVTAKQPVLVVPQDVTIEPLPGEMALTITRRQP